MTPVLTTLGSATVDPRRAAVLVTDRATPDLTGLVRRLAGREILAIGREYGLGDQAALEAMILGQVDGAPDRPLFFWFERAVAEPEYGHECAWPAGEPDVVALAKRTWAVMALSLHIEQFVHAHFAGPATQTPGAENFADVLLHSWRAEVLKALGRERASPPHDRAILLQACGVAVDRFIRHVRTLDGALIVQAERDAAQVVRMLDRRFTAAEVRAVQAAILAVYRHRCVLAGAAHHHFRFLLSQLVTGPQLARIGAVLGVLRPR